MEKIDTGFADEIKKFGAKDFNACYNCGNCTAVCALTEKNANFPRKFIRLGLLGQKKEMLSSQELWLCYACGECSQNCPRQAAPGEYMAALRRYAIASFEPSGITKLIFKSNPFSVFLSLALAVILGFFLFTIKPEYQVSRWLFSVIPYDVIHNMGLVIFSLTGLSMLWGALVMMMKLISKQPKDLKNKNSVFKSIIAVIDELALMKRYRKCDSEEYAYWSNKNEILKPWVVHWSIMWGFIGLLLATILDFILKDPSTTIWLPSRVLGTIAGLLMMYGSTLAIIYRIKKVTTSYASTKLPDWMLLFSLWIAGFTGFWIEVAVTIHADRPINHALFLVHTIISMELVLLFSFSKFAHALYRPIALFFYFRNREDMKTIKK